nr:ATP-dependent DNA helicase PIF1-like [Tanacetum cinerariifolium]
MSAALRSKGDIVLNVASSGIAALLLEGGRTTHSRFAIPINVVEDSMHCYEAFDRTLRDICRTDPSVASDQVFGGKVVLFGGDFRQILPVITNGGRQDVLDQRNLTKKEIKEFADWISEIGNGKVGGANDGESTIVFLDNMLIPETDDDVGAIIDDTYPNLLQNL